MKLHLLAAFAAAAITPSAYSAVMLVDETFNGAGALVTPAPGTTGDHTGDHTGATYTVTFTETVGCAVISFDVSVSVGGGPVHFDNRGFGDSGGNNDSFQASAETMTFTLGAVSATPSAAAPAGSTVTNNTVAVQFSSFDLVNNGGNPPAVTWTTDNSSSGTTTAPAGSGSGDITLETGVIGATKIDIAASNAWMWLNNAQFRYRGTVTVEKVPEPTTPFLGALGSILLLARRRR